MGGEKSHNDGVYYQSTGSPPHRRGKDTITEKVIMPVGITPAQTGKGRCSSAKGKAVQDHPRMGGEKGRGDLCTLLFPGSPPHKRGKVPFGEQLGDDVGITPAQAGKRDAVIYARYSSQDHPRTSGEKCPLVSSSVTMLGSPPHKRGKGAPPPGTFGYVGITPAQAGKRLARNRRKFAKQDHPRTGGEKTPWSMPPMRAAGSPPHRRGKDAERAEVRAEMGITPAWAGKRKGVCVRCYRSRDHPRAGGEKVTSTLSRIPK